MEWDGILFTLNQDVYGVRVQSALFPIYSSPLQQYHTIYFTAYTEANKLAFKNRSGGIICQSPDLFLEYAKGRLVNGLGYWLCFNSFTISY